MYKVGDLSGKKSVSTGYDDNLPLFNKFSVAGRAVKNGYFCSLITLYLNLFLMLIILR